MGYRLSGPEIRQKTGKPASIISEGSLSGNVQIPPNGQPIILLAEQTVGGYAKIATVISSDLGQIGQAIPGNLIRFQQVDLATAYALKRQRQQNLDHIRTILALDLLDAKGGLYSKGEDWLPHIEVDDNLVTGQNPASSKAAGEAIVELLRK